MKAAALCMGYGGLELALEDVLGTETVWCSEVDADASTVIDARWPGVANLGDLKKIDWSAVEPVDVLTAGYPCQPFSHAGLRKGTDDPRHLWPYIADAVRVLRPSLVFLENVAGHLSLGFDVVLADLAEAGFDAEWCVVRASDVGACHQRARLFVVASDAGGERHGRGQDNRGVDDVDDVDAREARQRQRARTLPRDRSAAPADSDCGRRVECDAGQRRVPEPDQVHAWGVYSRAIDRHARTLGRRPPAPVDDKGRLSPRFVEWMQMLPEGWVTDVLPKRTAALKMLGNGVVPAQAACALRELLESRAAA